MYEKFKKLLDENGVTSYRVHKATGISTATLSDWKNGKSEPKKDKIEKICDYFNVPISYFYNDEYYTNEDTALVAQEIFEKEKVLFDVYRGSNKDKLLEYARKLKELEGMEKFNL